MQGLALFPNHEPWFFLWLNLGNPNLMSTVILIQPTVISCTINTVSLFFSGIQDRGAGTPSISLRRHVEGSMRLFFKKPVIMSRTSPISSLRTPATRTSLSCSTKTSLSLILWCLPSGRAPQAEVLGAWFYSSFEAYCDALHFLEHQQSHFAQYTFTMSLPRNVTHPRSYFSGCTGT